MMKGLCATLRYRVEDKSGLSQYSKPVIWAFWHNQLFVMPTFYRRFQGKRKGAVMTSASHDGELIARVMKQFGVESVRGSSSRHGSRAYKAALEYLQDGCDIVITPDGPRGPIYQLHPGVCKLAQSSSIPILPIHIHFSKSKRFASWDRFHLPLPFSKVTVTLEPLIHPQEEKTEGDLARISERLQSLLLTHETS